jgi:hypothetical protein
MNLEDDELARAQAVCTVLSEVVNSSPPNGVEQQTGVSVIVYPLRSAQGASYNYARRL